MRSDLHDCRDQSYTESCTGFDVAAQVEYWLGKGGFSDQISPLWLWVKGKELHGYPTANKGVWLRNTYKALYKEGFVLEKSFPFTPTNYFKLPKSLSIASSVPLFYLKHYTDYRWLNSIALKDALAKQGPVSVGLMLNSSFYGNKNGFIDGTKKSNGLRHAMLVVGYDNSIGCYIVRNSWGESWGDNGYCYVPFTYLNDNSIDISVITEKKGVGQ